MTAGAPSDVELAEIEADLVVPIPLLSAWLDSTSADDDPIERWQRTQDRLVAAVPRLLEGLKQARRDYLELGEELATELAEERTLHQQVEAVRALHRRVRQGNGDSCDECLTYTSPMPTPAPWPCRTVRALDAEDGQ